MTQSAKIKILALMVAGCGMLCNPVLYAADSMVPESQATQESSINDTALKTALQSSLAPYAGKIVITVTNGVANLSGQLDSETDYENAVTVTESTNGVVDVNVDELTVKDSKNPLTDTYITAKVKGSLLRSNILGKDIPAWSVHVETKNGQVYLSGTIESKSEEEQILANVMSVKGVSKVINEMKVANDASESY